MINVNHHLVRLIPNSFINIINLTILLISKVNKKTTNSCL
jgi:hypothetical protein